MLRYDRVDHVLGSLFVVKYLPAWLPGAQFKRDARVFKEVADRAKWLPFDMVKRQVRLYIT